MLNIFSFAHKEETMYYVAFTLGVRDSSVESPNTMLAI
jgi:hypothetical protein